MGKWLVLLGVVGFLFCSVGFAADAPTVVSPNDAVTSGASGLSGLEASNARSAEHFAAKSLTWRQRQDLGLTIPKISAVLKDLQKEGQLEKGMDKSVVAAMVLERLSAENPRAYSDRDIDIETILKFIEAILPLIMALIQLFSYVTPAASIAWVACLA